ncbi:MAG TPA: glycosyltransferase [Candidatus Angelobacter sp.]|jgi:sugar transferase (PEP-CTERM/EpsH1 system associated)
MRRAHIIHVLHRMGAGGTELALRKVVAGLDAERFEHTICTVAPVPASELTTDVRFVSLERSGKKTGSLVGDLTRLFLREKPDIVHSRNWGAIEAIVAGKLARVPRLIHSEHGRDINTMNGDPWRRRVFRRFCYSLTDEVFAVSRELREHYAKQVGLAPARISVIPNGVDLDRFRPDPATRSRLRAKLGAAEQEIVLGTVGRLDPVKDHATLLAAAEQVIAAGMPVRVVIVGDGPGKEQLQAAIEKSSSLHACVTLAGESSKPEEWLNSFDVFVLPSLSEGMSNTVLEAMATELPCVVTSVGANPDLVESDKTGFLLEPRDFRTLARHVLQLGSDRDLRSAFGKRARQKVECDFSLQRMLENYSRLYTVRTSQKSLAGTAMGRA